MNRRTLLLGGLAVAATGAALSPTIRTIVLGHAKDAQSRVFTSTTPLTDGQLTHKGHIRENDPGQDTLHRAGGTITITNGNILQLHDDFWSTPGPDYHVYISNDLDIIDEATFNSTDQIELERLKSGKGSQEYILPANMSGYDISMTIWCKAFGEFIGSANIRVF